MINNYSANLISNSQPIKPPVKNRNFEISNNPNNKKILDSKEPNDSSIISFRAQNNKQSMGISKQKLQEIKEVLDQNIYEIQTTDGKTIKGTIKEYIQANIEKIIENDHSEGLLHGTSKEARKSILENGFDQNKVSRTVCGPGTCFTGSEYEAHQIGGGAIIKCSYSGTSAVLKHGFFDKIRYNDAVVDDISKMAEIKLYPETYSQTYYNKVAKVERILGEYVRDVLVNQLHIDAGIDRGRQPCIPGCFVVYNTKTLSDLKAYN